ncbi:MAG: efflux RND transporter permease subunit [Pararhizobium sp.]
MSVEAAGVPREPSGRRGSLASFFIARPVFAMVLAIATMLAGIMSIYFLSISQYPEIAPTSVRIRATYTGATADTVENSVTKPIEDAMTGLDGLLYMNSRSTNGQSDLTLTFDGSIDPEIAQVEVQNKLSPVETKLPDAVQQQGVTVTHSTTDILMIGSIISTDGKYTSGQLANIETSVIEDPIQRVDGVGAIQSFVSSYAMRVWLDPMKLQQYQLTPTDVVNAIKAQNVNVSAGAVGASPAESGQRFTANVTAQSELTNPDQFKAIVIKYASDGSTVRVDDDARVELGMETYARTSSYDGQPAAGFGVQLASGANAVSTAQAVHKELDTLQASLPPGVKIITAYETTPFVLLSIEKVVETLVEAIVLVFFILLLFLQNLRATLIPMIAVPVVLMGTFGVLAGLGYSINTLTMFAMVLAIGLLVDDAIVVVENVERIMDEEGLSAREATEKSMSEITSALIGIALVLTAVFIPRAFFSGSVGVIYRQFSVTIVSAMILSVLVAIILTPALCAMMLKPSRDSRARRWFGWFNHGVDAATNGYVRTVGYLVLRPLRLLVIYAAICGGAYWLYTNLPTSFLPQEDQGVLMTQIQLPDNANAVRTQRVLDQVLNYYRTKEKNAVEGVFMTLGFSYGSTGENNAMAFVRLKDFDVRKGKPELSAAAVARRATKAFRKIRGAQIYVLQPPTVRGLGQSNGFDMYLQDVGNQGRDALTTASNKLADVAQQDPDITNIRGNTRTLQSQMKINVDRAKASALGIDLSSINALINAAFAGTYVNDFVYQGDIDPVYVQGDAPYRMQPGDLDYWYAKNTNGEMVPFSAFASTSWEKAAPTLARFNGVPAVEIQGAQTQSASSGTVMDKMEQYVKELPGRYAVAWSGLSYQERLAGSQATLLYAVSVLVVFLCLAALYESWSIPFSVILAVPIGVFGALVFATVFQQSNDVYFKVGLLTTIGLAAKNAILIVEFAKDLHDRGQGVVEAVLGAAKLRLRPIVMTSLAFILGVLPLAIATGAGSGAQNSVGFGVLGGMIAATGLGVFFVPTFFVAIVGGFRLRRRKKEMAA